MGTRLATRRSLLSHLLCTTAVVVVPGAATAAQVPAPPRKPLPPADRLVTLDWDDLLPEIERGKTSAGGFVEHDYLGEDGPAARQSGSAVVRSELDGRRVKLPGFIVPLSLAADGRVTEFFLVPFFGACIHVPPPAPNQIVFGRSTAGFRQDSIQEPYWLTGRLRTKSRGSRLGTAAYSLEVETLERYAY
jgi:uncharacterized protein